jgi:hypothetical protein
MSAYVVMLRERLTYPAGLEKASADYRVLIAEGTPDTPDH